MALNNKQKRTMKAEANELKPEIIVGKDGVTAGVIQNTSNAFNTKELVKIKILESCAEDKTSVAKKLIDSIGAELVQIIGRTIILYKELPEDK